MVGQAPFVGYTVADFAPGSEPEVSVDTSLLTASEEPEYFIAVAGERTVALEAYTVIELPWAEVNVAAGAAVEPVADARDAAAREEERLALTEARARLALVTAELDKVREQHQSEGATRRARPPRRRRSRRAWSSSSSRARRARAACASSRVARATTTSAPSASPTRSATWKKSCGASAIAARG